MKKSNEELAIEIKRNTDDNYDDFEPTLQNCEIEVEESIEYIEDEYNLIISESDQIEMAKIMFETYQSNECIVLESRFGI